jgi:hypothetical protein
MENDYGSHIVIVYQCETSTKKIVCAHLLDSDEVIL